jgi:hypothetical protein
MQLVQIRLASEQSHSQPDGAGVTWLARLGYRGNDLTPARKESLAYLLKYPHHYCSAFA